MSVQALLARCRARVEAIHHSVILIVALADDFLLQLLPVHARLHHMMKQAVFDQRIQYATLACNTAGEDLNPDT
jgi:hypothetical protein